MKLHATLIRLCLLLAVLVSAVACHGVGKHWKVNSTSLGARDGETRSVGKTADGDPINRTVWTETPGWFDVGAGSGAALNVHSKGENNDALGILMSLRAYPLGRWYTLGKDEQGQTNTYMIDYTGEGEEGLDWLRRASIFYGISAGNFTGGGLESEIHVLGLAYDVAPEFALLLGCAMYEFDDDGDKDTDFGAYVGISLNLNAFRKYFAGFAGVDIPSK